MKQNALKLHSENYDGNLHETVETINTQGLAEYVVVMQYSNGSTQVVFKMPAWKVWEIRKRDRAYVSDVHHDDQLQED